jgi:uncharacterized protein (DUF2267 family)
MALRFEKFAMKGNEFINQLATKLGDEADREKASRILRAVLRVLRNKLSLEDNLELLSHLPMAIKGAYVDGWKIDKQYADTDTLEDLVGEILKEDGLLAKRDFKDADDVVRALRAVIETLIIYTEPEEAVCFE